MLTNPAIRRVLMSADTAGGVWTYALELARALEPHGIKVFLAAMGGAPTPRQRAEARAIRTLELLESDFKLEWMDDPWDDVERSGEWMLSLEERIRPDVVHLNGYAHGKLPFRAPVVVAGHSCVLSWWRAVKGEDAPRQWERYAREAAAGLAAAARVVSPTRTMLEALERHYSVKRGTVVRNARSQHLFAPAPKAPFIFAAGRLWDEAKNISTLAEAARGLAWPVSIAGDTRHPSGREARFDAVRFLGILGHREIADYAARAAIYALPARYEPFGLSILEAALSGCALVLGDIPSLRELWEGAAFFVEPGDPVAVHHAVAALIRDEGTRTLMQNLARRRALDFTPERMAAGYLALYLEVSGREYACAS